MQRQRIGEVSLGELEVSYAAARALLAKNETVQAFANLFGIIAGLVLLWTVGRFAWRFTRDVYRTSVRTALRRRLFKAYREAVLSATDIHLLVGFSTRRIARIGVWLSISSLAIWPVSIPFAAIATLECADAVVAAQRLIAVRRHLRRGLRGSRRRHPYDKLIYRRLF